MKGVKPNTEHDPTKLSEHLRKGVSLEPPSGPPDPLVNTWPLLAGFGHFQPRCTRIGGTFHEFRVEVRKTEVWQGL